MIGVRNAGEQVSPETSGWVYIDNHSAGSFRIPSLHPREGVQSIRLRYNLICSGTADTIRIVLDNTNQVPESNEDDNEYTFTAECIKTPTGVADLIIRQAWLETIGTFKWKIGYEIKNQGDGYACASQTGLYVDNTLKADDYVDRLAPGESVEKTFWWNYSMEDCTPPSDTIRIYADYRAAIPETNESNNEYSLSCECMEVPTTPIQKPDLVVLQCSYSYPVLTDDVTVRCRIMNRGYAPAPPSTAKLYIGYQEFDTESVPQLEPGDSVDITFDRIWHPRTTTYFVANYSIEVVVDSDNVVDEIPYEDNNIWRTYWEFPLTCDDGIQNRDEEGVDCGGSFCIPCGDPCDPTTPLPRHFDWRDYYTFPPIRNQGNCGSCWAHSAIGAVEGTYIVKRRVQSIDLSEQELISCSDAGSCSGGQYHRALEYIKNNGVVEESCFPYCACDTSCSKCSDWNSKLWGIASYHVITSRNVEEIKRALICHGPLAAKSSYSSHAMVIVGYDDFLNGGSWIMRNSHGPGSCDNGYCYVLYSRGDEIKILALFHHTWNSTSTI
jgi:C1A family cysteine protease